MLYDLLNGLGSGKKYAYMKNSEADKFTFWRGDFIKDGMYPLKKMDGTIEYLSAKNMRMRADCNLSAFDKMLYLPNVSGQLVFRIDLVAEMQKWFGDQLQFFDMELTTKDAVTHDYQIANITHTVQAYDLEKSDLTWSYPDNPDFKTVCTIKKLIFRDDSCMNGVHIAMEQYSKPYVIVTEECKQWLESRKVKGLRFRRDFEVR